MLWRLLRLLLVAPVAGIPAFAPRPRELIYQVTSREDVPNVGEVHANMTVRMHVEPPLGGTRRVRVDISDVAGNVGRRTALMRDQRRFPMDLNPFVFELDESGAVSRCYHAPGEKEQILGSKRAIAAAFQWIDGGGRRALSVADTWSGFEADAVGPATAEYRRTPAVRGRESTELRKRLSFHESKAVPRGFAYEVNSTARFERGEDMPSLIRTSAFFHVQVRPRPIRSPPFSFACAS